MTKNERKKEDSDDLFFLKSDRELTVKFSILFRDHVLLNIQSELNKNHVGVSIISTCPSMTLVNDKKFYIDKIKDFTPVIGDTLIIDFAVRGVSGSMKCKVLSFDQDEIALSKPSGITWRDRRRYRRVDVSSTECFLVTNNGLRLPLLNLSLTGISIQADSGDVLAGRINEIKKAELVFIDGSIELNDISVIRIEPLFKKKFIVGLDIKDFEKPSVDRFIQYVINSVELRQLRRDHQV